jgi:hypothetical protein
VSFETDESPTGWNHRTDSPTYTSYTSAVIGDISLTSVGFSPGTEIGIDGQDYSFSDALKIIDANVMKQILNPRVYTKILGPEFEKEAADINPEEPGYNDRERD